MQDIRHINISTNTIIRILLLGLGAYLIYMLRDTLLLVLVSIVLASFVEAGVRFFKKYRIQRSLSVPIIFTVAILIVGGIFYAFVPILFRELSGVLTTLIGYLPNTGAVSSESIEGASQLVTSLGEKGSLTDLLESVKSISSAVSQGATSVIGATFGSAVNTILVLVMSFYLSIQEKGIETFLRILTPARHEQYVISLWARTQYKIGLWFQGQLMLGVLVGAVTTVVLALMGVKYAFLIGLITGIAELIPFGVIFAAVPAILFGAIDGGVVLGVKILVFYIIVQQLENYVLNPLISRRVVGIPPLVVLLAFMIGIALAGFWGTIIAIPVAVFVLEYMGDVEKQKLVPVIDTNPR